MEPDRRLTWHNWHEGSCTLVARFPPNVEEIILNYSLFPRGPQERAGGGGQLTEQPADDHAARVRAKNRLALIWIPVACVVLATLDFLFAL